MNGSEDRIDLRVIGSTLAADGVLVLDLAAADGGVLPSWAPGAHIEVYLTDDLTRHYSLCPSPGVDRWRIAVLLERDGRGGSRFVHEVVSVGSSLTASTPRNHFPLVSAQEYLFIAGGIGITPLLAMMSEVACTSTPWRLVYGGRQRQAMAFAHGLEQAYPDNVSVLPQDEGGLLDLVGLLGAASAETAIFACGPPSMLDAVHAATSELALERVHVERFSGAGAVSTPPSPARSFELVLGRSGTAVTVGSDESIVDALEQVGVRVTTSCREGICGSCETKVLAGTPLHRDSVLSEDERSAGATMMVCVGGALSPSLTLDV